MIKWNEVTWYSKLGAIILFLIVVPVFCFYIGTQYQEIAGASMPIEKNLLLENIQPINSSQEDLIASTTVVQKFYKNAAWSMSMQLPIDAFIKEINCNDVLCQINISGSDYRVILRKIDDSDTEFATSSVNCGNSILYFNFDNYKSKSSEIGKQMISTLRCL